ncbi:hypothetical protein B7982_01785 [Fibrobacter sp. UWB2]|nr:hypothetical protein B7982_01785 [Fibrobacter sp. UWB2]
MYIAFNDESSLSLSWALVLFNGVILSCVIVNNINKRNFFSLINIADFFLFFVFFIRPIQIFFTQNQENSFYVFWLYNTYTQSYFFSEMPVAKASFIGLLGIGVLNLSFLFSPIRNTFFFKKISKDYFPRSLTKNQIYILTFVFLLSLLSIFSYASQIMRGLPIHMFDVVWVYLFSVIIIYIIYEKKTPNLFVYFLIILSVYLFSFVGKRQYITNLLICYIIPLYSVEFNRKKNMKKIGVMVAVLFIVVWLYGIIRLTLLGGTPSFSFVFELLNEFCMFDMLVVSLKFFSEFGMDYFYGFNYLSFFTMPIPGLAIPTFDHELTRLVFNEAFHGGIPVTLFGSFYLNFSYIGLIIGSIFFGFMLRYLESFFSVAKNVASVTFFTILATFIYDIVRVGDISRELWTLIIMLTVAKIFLLITPTKD